MRKSGMRLFRIAGLELRLDASWLPVAVLMTWSLSQAAVLPSMPGISVRVHVAVAVCITAAFFAGLVLHELAHAIVAQRFGLKVGGITLYAFGGLAELAEDPRDPTSEFWIALAGPVMSALLALGLAGIASLPVPALLAVSAARLAAMNLSLALFNLVPAYPLDGGRILRAALWGIWQDRDRATQVSAFAGMAFGWGLILSGAVLLFASGDGAGLWLMLIGTVLLTLARAAQTEVRLGRDLLNREVATIMSPNPAFARPQMPLSEVIDRLVLGKGRNFLPVVSEEGMLVGTVDTAAIRRVEREAWPAMTVARIMEPLRPEGMVTPGTSCHDALLRMTQGGRRKLVVERQGHLVGVVTLADLVDYAGLIEGFGDPAEGRRPKPAGPLLPVPPAR